MKLISYITYRTEEYISFGEGFFKGLPIRPICILFSSLSFGLPEMMHINEYLLPVFSNSKIIKLHIFGMILEPIFFHGVREYQFFLKSQTVERQQTVRDQTILLSTATSLVPKHFCFSYELRMKISKIIQVTYRWHTRDIRVALLSTSRTLRHFTKRCYDK